jgi:hypothetical protein
MDGRVESGRVKSDFHRAALEGLRYECESPLAVPCESWEGLARFIAPADNMNPVYTDVKGRSTRYCALKIGQAQDIDILPRIARLFLNALF